MKPRDILLPLDGASCADAAVSAAAVLAQPGRATVHLLYVVDIARVAAEARRRAPGLFDFDQLTDYPDAITKEHQVRGRESMDKAQARLAALGIPVTRQVEHGSPAGLITNRGRDADVVVLGRRGENGRGATDALGATAARVLARLPAPVLLAGPEVHDGIKSPLLVYEGRASHGILVPALDLCGALGACLTILHVSRASAPEDRLHVERHLAGRPAEVRWVEAGGGETVPRHTQVLAAAGQWRHDLVILGARSLCGGDVGGESSSGIVTRQASAPVLILR